VQIAIYISDGAANLDVPLTLPHAIQARNDEILLIAVSVGLDANVALLAAMVTRPPEAHLFVLTSSRALPGVVNNVVEATCNDINECQPQPCQAGARCVDTVCNAMIIIVIIVIIIIIVTPATDVISPRFFFLFFLLGRPSDRL